MANKSFVIQYVIKAREKYSAVSRKVAESTELMKRKIDSATKSFRRFGEKTRMAGAAMTAGITLPVSLAAKSMIDAASDAEETRNKFFEVFKGIEKEGSSAVGSLSKNFMLAESTSQELLSSTGDLLVGLGLSRSEALKLSKSVVELSADVASFKNVEGGTERAAISLTKALLGEREMLKETFKTAVLESEVKEAAAKLTEKNKNLTMQQAKALATLEIVTRRNKDAIGDFARTQDQYANQARISEEATKRMRESFGKLLLPIAIVVTKSITSMVNWLNELSPASKKVMLAVIGVVAVLGPLLLFVAGIGAAIPFVTAGLAGLGVAITFMTGPVGLVIAGIAAAAYLIINNWQKISDFFSRFASSFKRQIQPIIDIINSVTEAISFLFDSADRSGSVGGRAVRAKGIAQNRDRQSQPVDLINTRVDVGVNVGLDQGLKETTPRSSLKRQRMSRRSDVGLATAG